MMLGVFCLLLLYMLAMSLRAVLCSQNFDRLHKTLGFF